MVTEQEVRELKGKAENAQGFDQGDYSVIVRMCHDLLDVSSERPEPKKRSRKKKP